MSLKLLVTLLSIHEVDHLSLITLIFVHVISRTFAYANDQIYTPKLNFIAKSLKYYS